MIIHLLGAQKSNYPWGFENRLIPAIESLGHQVISTDFRQERQRLPELLSQKANLMLICKGEGIDPHLIESCPCVTSLWYAEQLGTAEKYDETALHRRKELAFNIQAYDYVFSHDPANLDVYRELGAERSHSLPCAAVDPNLNRKIDAPKKYDVVFVGTKTTRREKILADLSETGISVYSPNIWNAEEMNRVFNESRIVINLHLSDLLNTETRVAEVLGAGSFLLSETLSDSEIAEDKEHYVSFAPGNIQELTGKIRYYLENENEREAIAAKGHAHIHAHHRYADRIQMILGTVDFSINKRIWPSYVLGVPANTYTKPTLRLDRYYTFVRDIVDRKLEVTEKKSAKKTVSFYEDLQSFSKSLTVPKVNKERHLRIFAAFANVNWEKPNLLPALESFGEVVWFNWNPQEQYAPDWHTAKKIEMNLRLLQTLESEHRKQPFDVFFGYLSGRLIFPGYVRYIRELGIPTLNLCLDDRRSFKGSFETSGWSGMVDLASVFDLCITSTKDAVKWYEQAGGRAKFMPAGANHEVYRPIEVPFDIDVSFIGQCYGERPKIIDRLRTMGIEVKTFGRGWPSGEVPTDDMVKIYNRSRINIGFAMIGDSGDTFCLKGRDLEVPMAGGLYLTQYHPELEDVYEIGKEIVCFQTVEELAEKIKHYLAHPEEAAQVRKAGLERAQRDHTWHKRFETAFQNMKLI